MLGRDGSGEQSRHICMDRHATWHVTSSLGKIYVQPSSCSHGLGLSTYKWTFRRNRSKCRSLVQDVPNTFSKFSLNICFLFFICCLDGDFNRFRMSHGKTVLKKRKNRCKTHELLTFVTDSHLEHTWNAMTTMTTKLVSGGARSRRAGDDFWKNTGHCESPAIYAVKTRDL